MEEKMRILEDLNMIYIRQIALSLQDSDIQKKIDHEIRMRDGTCKLLAACSQKDQALEAAKSLLTCNARILAYMSELQRMKEAQVMQRAERRPSDASALDNRIPCQGKVAISDLRIPLMWKDTEYFKNKGELHRCAVFCVLQLGGQIFDTDMVMVDRTLTDICFENTIVFNDVSPGFELRVDLYSCCTEEGFSGGNAPKKLSGKLSSSLGRSTGKKVRAALETGPCSPVCNGGGSPILLPSPTIPGPKYHLLAHTTLTLAHVRDSFRTHDLSVCGSEECSYWLPLYGRVCCRLAARPDCMTQEVMSGSLKVRLGEDPQCWTNIYGVLRGTNLMCFHQLEDTESGVEPVFTIAINKETRIRATEKEPLSKLQSISISNHYGGEEVNHTLATDSREDTQRWMEAFWQQFYDMSQWKQCCDSLMKIEVPSPRKPTIVTAKQGSLYHEMVIEAADDPDVVKDIWKRQMQDFESCSQPGTHPQCTALFEEARGCRAAVHSPRPRCRAPRSPDPSPRSACDSEPRSYPWGLETPFSFRHRALSADTKAGSLLASRHGAPQCRHQARPPSSTQTTQHSLSSTSTSSSADGSTTSDTDSAPYSRLAKPPRPRGPASQTGPVPMATNACVTPSPKHAPKGMFTPLSPHRIQSQDSCSRVAEPRKSYQHVRQ